MQTNHTIADWNELGITGLRRGQETRVNCPFCNDDRKPEHRNEKDFAVSPDGEKGYCHHCGASANIRTRGEALPSVPVARPSVSTTPRSTPDPTPDTLEQSRDAWRPFIESRGLELGVLEEQYGVRWIWRHDMGHTMVIPQHDPQTGELCNHKYRALDKKFRNDKGTWRPMYNLERAKGAETIVIVEGEMDVYAFEAAGFPHVVSVPDGAPPLEAKNYSREFAYLEQALPILLEADRIILAIDNDPAGDKLRDELEHRIGIGNCAHIRFPDGTKDANDALLNLGAYWLIQQVKDARPTPTEGVFTPLDAWTEIEHALKYGFDTGTPIGFPDLDKIYRPTAGHLTIVTGHAGSGKSTVLDNCVIKLVRGQGWPICYFSPEQMPIMRHLMALAEIDLGKPTVQDRARLFGTECATREELRDFIERIDPYISHLSPEMADESPSLDRILEMATAEVRRIGIKGLILDPWNELETARPTNITETEWVSVALGKIRRWARKHRVHVWLVAHPKKMQTEQGRDAKPGLGDISGSNNFRNKADYGLTVHGDPDVKLLPGQTSTVTVTVTKARWKDSAMRGGEATFVYDPASNRISTPPSNYLAQVQPQYQHLFQGDL